MGLTVILFAIVVFVLSMGSSETTQPKLQTNNVSTNITHHMIERFKILQRFAAKSILVHVHIPKAGGTALSAALSSNCKCLPVRPVVDGVSQPNCKKCKYVKGSKGMKVEYTVSRNTGWKIGVHSPYAVMRWALTRPTIDIRNYQINSTFIIMQRDPFDRFISEALHWVGPKGQAVDWSVKVKNGASVEYYKGVNLTYGRNLTEQNTLDFVKQYSSLPQTFILHNRQTKMIGGKVFDFNMAFDPMTQLGSRWVPQKIGRGSYINVVFERARRVLTEEPLVILALQERFAKSICILEIVYGHLYRFNWQDNKHSHKSSQHFDVANTSYKTNPLYKDVYDLWAERNEADIKLYAASVVWFESQFQVAIQILRARVASSRAKLDNTPHCVEFL